MAMAHEKGFRSIAFPLIGAGSGGFNPERVKAIMEDELTKTEYPIEVRLVVFRKPLGEPTMHKRRTWVPILLGVICGVLAIGPSKEPVCRFIISTFPGPFEGRLPTACGIYWTIYVYAVIAFGGFIGVLFSQWRKKTALLFLMGTLMLFIVFGAAGRYLERSR